jgi:alkyl hydroperoxide reductase subunit AhpF
MLLSISDREKLRDELAQRLEGDVAIELFVDDGQPSRQALALVEELTSLTPRFSFRVRVERDEAHVPALRLAGAAKGDVRFTGLPTGYEFPTLIDALITVSTGRTPLSLESRELAAAVEEDIRLRIFTTPT